MSQLLLIENEDSNTKLFSKSSEVILHEDVLEILFKYKDKICTMFDNIRGTFFIDHLAINIIDPSNRVMIFSTTPSVEYNLISKDLWKYDNSFSISYQINNRFYSWEKAYEQNYFETLKLTKQINHGFTCGFNLSKKIETFQLIYSFATRHQENGLLEYYRNCVNELFAIGDYGYKAILGIYEKRFGKISTTKLDKTQNIRSFSPFLRIINSEVKS